MVSIWNRVSLTLRERHGCAGPIGLWALMTAFLTMTGPFETYAVLSPLPRLAYWAGVVALSIGLSFVAMHLLRGRGALWRRAGWLPFALVLAGLVQMVNRAVFGGWSGVADYLWLVGIVLAVCVMIELSLLLLAPPETPATGQTDPERALLRRLPVARRGPLIRIEAQDHYLSVVTEAGTSMILMRMADAQTMLQDAGGLRVHRSHWVKCAAVRDHRRRDGRDFLVMADDCEIPVSRSSRAAVLAAGLIAQNGG